MSTEIRGKVTPFYLGSTDPSAALSQKKPAFVDICDERGYPVSFQKALKPYEGQRVRIVITRLRA